MIRGRARAAWCAALLLAACSSGVGGVVPHAAAPANETVAFTVVVPRGTSSAQRTPAYVSPATQSIGITVTAGGAAAGSAVANCASNQCTVNVEAPVGSDTFTISLFDAQNGAGNLLSSGSLTQMIHAGMLNTINVTFDGVVKSIAISANPASLPPGTAGTSTLTIKAMDADGNVIVAPGTYSTPIVLADGDTSGVTGISPTTITGPGQTATLSYSGGALASATVTASATGITPASATIAFVKPTPAPPPTAPPTATPTVAPTITPTAAPTITPTAAPTITPTAAPTTTPTAAPTTTPTPAPGVLTVSPSALNFPATGSAYNQTFTASESGYSGTFTESDNCATGSIASVSPSSASGPSATFTVTPQNAGSCTITVTDSHGNSASVSVGVTVTQGVIN